MAARELPRRLAALGRAVAAHAFTVRDLARSLAEPALLARGRRPWNPGHELHLARHLLDTGTAEALGLPEAMPRTPVGLALARTLGELRRAGVPPESLERLAAGGEHEGDAPRLSAVAGAYRRFHDTLEGRFADTAALLRAALDELNDARWLAETELVVVGDPELDPLEERLLQALCRRVAVKVLTAERPSGLRTGSPMERLLSAGARSVPWSDTPLAGIAPPPPPPALGRLRHGLFEPPLAGAAAPDDSVELLTAPGEAAEARSIVRRILREAAAGTPFEEMGVVVPRADLYAPLFADLLGRLRIPYRLHPSVPLRHGRVARSLLLLFRCRGLGRSAVMEFLTFADIPFPTLLGPETAARPSQWDAISRDAQIVSGLDRWITGLRHYAQEEQKAADADAIPERQARRRERVRGAEALLRVVELLGQTLDGLDGEATWAEWSVHLRGVMELWLAEEAPPTAEHEKVLEVIEDLSAVSALSARAHWRDVEQVLEGRFEDVRLPVEKVETGAVHVGALDAMAGVPFRFVAVPGLVEGGYPGVVRPDPFLLDAERDALNKGHSPASPAVPTAPARRRAPEGQLALFADETSAAPQQAASDAPAARGLPLAQDRLLESRRLFHRAIAQATHRLVLSYPRADPRSGRERLPSLFFAAAAQALHGRPLDAAELSRLVREDAEAELDLDLAVDASERDRARVRRGGPEAARAVAAGSLFFRGARLSAEARWAARLTAYDGFLAPLPTEIMARLDPARGTVSASRLADYTKCGFLFLLRHVLRLQPALEPEERRKLQPLERGNLFHEVAERFLRERRDRGELPVSGSTAQQARLLEMCDEALEGLVAGSPPRFTLLWDRECARFKDTALTWLAREADAAPRARPRHFEVAFGFEAPSAPGEAFSKEPLTVDLRDGRTLRVIGRIDRIDEGPEGSLILRDYKTGKAPRSTDGSIFRGGQQLQIPFYVLAAAQIFPGQPVREAFLDYVDGGRQVAFDPEASVGERFHDLLRALAESVGSAVFPQEAAACDFCDYTAVCGPKGLIERRRSYKVRDPRLQRYLRLRDL
jgi:RecB family exonuclease